MIFEILQEKLYRDNQDHYVFTTGLKNREFWYLPKSRFKSLEEFLVVPLGENIEKWFRFHLMENAIPPTALEILERRLTFAEYKIY